MLTKYPLICKCGHQYDYNIPPSPDEKPRENPEDIEPTGMLTTTAVENAICLSVEKRVCQNTIALESNNQFTTKTYLALLRTPLNCSSLFLSTKESSIISIKAFFSRFSVK